MYKIGDIRNGYEVLPSDQRKTVLLLSDDLRMTSGVGNMSREFVMGTLHRFNWIQIGGAIDHPDKDKAIDMDQDVVKRTGVPDASLKIHPVSGYGDQRMVRQCLGHYKPHGIIIYTDPRFWEWLFQMEHEIRQNIPIMYYNIWDDLPYPMWNQKYYDSVDALFNISKQTCNIVRNVRSSYEDWQVTYIPHGINEDDYFPIGKKHKDYENVIQFRSRMLKGQDKDFILFYNARNIRRKLVSDIIYAYRTFCDAIPKDDAKKCTLIMHCTPIDDNGTNLPDVVRNLCPYDVVFSTSRFERDIMNYMYNIADCSILISSNEGFGLMGTESLITGTPLVVNISGGMQDYCGFKKKVATSWDADGNTTFEEFQYLTHEDYTTEWGSNHDGRYKDHGEWVFPVWPTSRSIQGSIPTPYISDDRPDFQDVAIQIKKAWSERGEKLEARGMAGREYVLNPEYGFSASEMNRRFVHDIEMVWEKWTPRPRIMLDNATHWEHSRPKWNGLTLTKEI
jgi:glycosyltransferase involved in cell wall biosynthesis